MSSTLRRSRLVTALVTFLAAFGLLVTTMPTTALADPATTGSISGTVTDSKGPVAWVQVTAFASGGPQYAVIADSDGTYTIPDLPFGSYQILASDSANHLMAWVGGNDNPTVFTVGATPITGANATMIRLGWVTGTITVPGGAPAAGASVTLFDPARQSGPTTTTASDGTFTIPSGPGTFILYAELADTYPKTYRAESGSTTHINLAAPISLSSDITLTRSFALQAGTHFTGTVTTDGVATSDVIVIARESIDSEWVNAGQGYTDAQGHYSLTVSAGSYQFLFHHVSTGRFLYQDVTVDSANGSRALSIDLLPAFDAAPAPTITGTATVGSTLTANAGTWSPAPGNLSYQWLRNGASVPGATADTYAVTTEDVGARLAVVVTATKAEYRHGSAQSANTATVPAVTPAPPTPTPTPSTITGTTPKITGTARVGKTLKVKRGTWSPSGLTYRYQWYRSGKAIKAATKSSYKLTKSDKRKYLTVKVTAQRTGYKTLSLTSKKTAKVR